MKFKLDSTIKTHSHAFTLGMTHVIGQKRSLLYCLITSYGTFGKRFSSFIWGMEAHCSTAANIGGFRMLLIDVKHPIQFHLPSARTPSGSLASGLCSIELAFISSSPFSFVPLAIQRPGERFQCPLPIIQKIADNPHEVAAIRSRHSLVFRQTSQQSAFFWWYREALGGGLRKK